MCDAGLDVVHLGATERVERHVLARGHANHLGSGDEHITDLVDHEGEVGDRGRVDRAARARSEDQAQLRDEAAGFHVAPEDFRVARQRDDPLLDPSAAGVVDPDDGNPVAQREIHDLDHLLGEHLAEGASEDRCIVAEQHHVTPVDLCHARDHAVAGHPPAFYPKTRGAVCGEQVDLLERVAVDQAIDALPGGELALGVLAIEGFGVAMPGLVLALAQLVECIDLSASGRRRHQAASPGRYSPNTPRRTEQHSPIVT